MDETEGILMADASNAFNRLNRQTCLRSVRHLCPSLATVLISTYRDPAHLYVDGESILSQEGTTQCDPLAMYMYALGIMPLIRLADEAGAVQSWFADDSSAAARLRRLRLWWDIMDKRGPAYGYYVNPKKSVLVLKERCYQEATELFRDTGVMITDEETRYLGAAIGRDSFLQSYIKTKVDEWMGELKKLAVFAQTQPQAAYSAYVTGLRVDGRSSVVP